MLNMNQSLPLKYGLLGVLVLLTFFFASPALADTVWHITDNATGGDCSLIGTWEAGSKTCALSQDLSRGIVIDSDNITLNGNGHTVTGIGMDGGIGVYALGKLGIAVVNLTISYFSYGIN